MTTATDGNTTTSTAINVRRIIQSMQSNIIYKMHANVMVDNTFSNEVEDGVIVLRYIPSIH